MSLNLYHKSFSSLKELRQEKAALIRSSQKKDASSFMEEGVADTIETVTDFLMSKGVSEKLLALSIPVIGFLERKLEKETLKYIIKKITTGYLKWKMLEVGLDILISTIRKKPKS